MGVLDARADAEKVGYSIIGEKEKDVDGVIDYDIHEEITIDASSVFNANNDTTTGMATVIPGVNAPKLKRETSIYGSPDTTGIGANISGTSGAISRPDDQGATIRTFTITDEYGDSQFTNYVSSQGVTYSGLKIPLSGWYQISVTYPSAASTFGWTIYWRLSQGGGSNDTIFHQYTTPYSSTPEKETFNVEFKKGDVMHLWLVVNRSSSTPLYIAGATATFTIAKL